MIWKSSPFPWGLVPGVPIVGTGCFGLLGGLPWGFGLFSFDVVFPPVGSPLAGPPVVVPPVVVPPVVVPPVVAPPVVVPPVVVPPVPPVVVPPVVPPVVAPPVVVPPVVPPVGVPLPVPVPVPFPVVCWMPASLARYCSTNLALVSGVSSGALRISCRVFFCWLDSKPACKERRI